MKLLRREGNKQIFRGYSNVPYYVTAGFALTYALILPVYTTGQLITFIAVCAGFFWLLRLVCRKGELEGELPPQPQPAPEAEEKPIPNRGFEIIDKARALNNEIASYDPSLSGTSNAILVDAEILFEYAEKHPEAEGQLRHFLRYYLPTLVKLLETRISVNELSVGNDSEAETVKHLHDAAINMRSAFVKAKDDILQVRAFDMDTDIAVMEQLLERDGFAAEDFRKEQNEKQYDKVTIPDIKRNKETMKL